MKIIKYLILLIPFLLAINSCKKDRLTGDNKILIGSWTTIPTLANCGTIPGQPHNPSLKLELIEKGKYKLCTQSGKKLELGQLLNVDGLVTFKCGDKNSFLNGRKIIKFNRDTLYIDRNGCNDDYRYRFVKN